MGEGGRGAGAERPLREHAAARAGRDYHPLKAIGARRRRILGVAALLAAGSAAHLGWFALATAAPFATLRLDIRPQGELFIDGVAKGMTPPLASVQITPGMHVVEVRRAGSSTLTLRVDAAAGEALTIRHTFAAPPPKSAWRKFFDQFK